MSKPEKIVEALLEMDAHEDPKEWLNQNSEEMLNHWEQIGGDFGDPWIYGGDWYNQFKHEIVHINGLEGEGIKDKEPWDIKLTPEELAPIMAAYPESQDDPNTINDNERERDDAIENLKMTKSEAFNEAVEIPVYRFLDEELGPDDWPKQDEIAAQFEPGVWASLPTAQKWIEVGRYHGFAELDSYPDRFTKAKLSKYLGLSL